MTTNRDLINNALAAPIAYLQTQTAWTDLNIQEFWSWTGNVFPLPQEGEALPSDRMPALVADIAGARKAEERTSVYDILELDITGALIFATQSGTNVYPATACLEALATLNDSLASSEARRTTWGAPSAVAGFGFAIEGVDVIPHEDDPESVSFVVGNWSLRIDQIMPHAQ